VIDISRYFLKHVMTQKSLIQIIQITKNYKICR